MVEYSEKTGGMEVRYEASGVTGFRVGVDSSSEEVSVLPMIVPFERRNEAASELELELVEAALVKVVAKLNWAPEYKTVLKAYEGDVGDNAALPPIESESKYGLLVPSHRRSLQVRPVRLSIRSPEERTFPIVTSPPKARPLIATTAIIDVPSKFRLTMCPLNLGYTTFLRVKRECRNWAQVLNRW